MTQIIGEKKADAIQVQLVGNYSLLLITQENDMLPTKLDTILIADIVSLDRLIDKLLTAKNILEGLK